MASHSCVLLPLSWPLLDSGQSFDDMKLVYVQGTQEYQHSVLTFHPLPQAVPKMVSILGQSGIRWMR